MNENDTIYEGELFDRLEATPGVKMGAIVDIDITPRKEIVWLGGRKLERVKTYETWKRVYMGDGKNKRVAWEKFDRG